MGGWLVGESENKTNSALLSWGLAELGNNYHNDNSVNLYFPGTSYQNLFGHVTPQKYRPMAKKVLPRQLMKSLSSENIRYTLNISYPVI